MILSLSIKNIVLIEKLDIEFERGLCVLTGETGAGKSILLDALGFVLGERASSKLIRHGEKQGSVTAVFDISQNNMVKSLLQEYEIDLSQENDELFLRRVISSDGKSKAFINEMPVNVNMLKIIAEFLLEIHGQHENNFLFKGEAARKIIDQYGKLGDVVSCVNKEYDKFASIRKQIEDIREMASGSEQDYLEHVVRELELLSPEDGEEEILDHKRLALQNVEKITEAANIAKNLLNGGIEKQIRQAQNSLYKVVGFEEVVEALERAAIEVEDASSSISSIASNIENNVGDLENIEERLFALRAAARKHRVPVSELPLLKDKLCEKLTILQEQENIIAELENKLSQAKKDYLKFAKNLSEARKEAALQLKSVLHGELVPLKMGGTRFESSFSEMSDFGRDGIDKIEFLASTNPGQDLAPLTKIASGGELSRFMLALKVALSGVVSVPTMIFDEIDTGIGGAVAEAVGKRLALLGKDYQVLVITHQPQVAALGNYHLKVSKMHRDNATFTNVIPITDQNRQQEIARMLSGEEVTDEAIAAAGKLLFG